MQYAELHSHDIYSPLDGVSTPEQYMKRAKEIGIDYVAQTNHGTHAGHRHHQRAAKEAGIIPILGEEGYFTADRFDRTSRAKREKGDEIYNHMTMLAQNDVGLTNLRKMNEIAWTEGFYEKPRIDLDVLEEYNEGVIILSGCLSGVLAKAIEHNLPTQADQYAAEFKRIFGERYFVELMSHNPKNINKGLVAIAKKHGFKTVVTSDCHHARKEDLWIQEAVLILSAKPKPAKDFDFSKSQKMGMLERFNYLWPERRMSFQEFDLHLNSAEEHLAGLKKHGIGQEAIDNTMVVAKMIDYETYPYYEGLDLLPKPKEDEGDSDVLLEALVGAGLNRLGLTSKVYVDRAARELKVIKDKGFSPYFHIGLKGVAWAKSQGIRVGPGRGSGAGSLVCYALGLTMVDPIEHNLLFERFIDPSRPDWPDLDIDFQDDRREEVKAFMRREFDHVASIATFSYYDNKSALRAAARVFRIPNGEVNKAMKKINDLDDYKNSTHSAEFRKKYPEVERLAQGIVGTLASTGMHAGGLVVSNRHMSDIVPVQTSSVPKQPSAPRVQVVMYDMNEIADVGLIKFDFLGLKALTIVSEAERLIEERHGIKLDLDNHPKLPEDAGVYEMISQGYTRGVFQCNQAPYTRMLVEMGGVKNFDELVVSNALVRPGAADSSFGAAYIQGKNGGEYEFIHADTEWFTRETYGQIIYQEQQMHLCTELAGMTVVESNKVRKAIGKKIPEDLAKWKDVFIEGASKKVSEKYAEEIWHDLEAAANYSFNKSHAVAYSLISYQTAWLKYYYPLEFITAALNSESDKDEILNYLIESKRLGLRLMLPNINKSDLKFSIQSDDKGDYIRMGLSNIKFISDKIGQRFIDHRPFGSYKELEEKVLEKGSGLNSRALQSLRITGAAVFPDNPRTGEERKNYYEYLNLPAFNTDLPLEMKEQFRPLDEYSENEAFVVLAMVRGVKSGDNWTRAEIVDETGSAGVFTNEHTNVEVGQMYVLVIADNRIARYISVNDVMEDKGGDLLEFLEADSFPDIPDGMWRVVSFNSRTTKAGKRMANIVVSNGKKELVSALVFPTMFMEAFSKCREGAVVDMVFGETKEGTLFVDRIL